MLKPKEGGSSKISCPILTDTNYAVWTIRIRLVLKVNKVWDLVEKESKDSEENDLATALIFQALPETLVLQLGNLETAKKVWDAIKERYLGADLVKKARLTTLASDLERLKMKDKDTISDIAGKLTELSSKATALGEPIEEHKLIKKFMSCLPRKKYIQIVATVEQFIVLKTAKFENIVGRFKAYEERIKDEDDEETQSKLMYASNETQFQPQHAHPTSNANNRDYNSNFRGRGQGNRFYNRGRGRGRYNGAYQDRYQDTFDMSKVMCFRCDKMGHFASVCPDRLLKLQEATETKDADTT